MPRPLRTIILAAFTLTLCLFALPNALSELLQPTARAASTFTVNSTGDGPDSNTSDGVCNDGSGNCTLRAAIEQANATPGTDTIAFNIPGSGVRTIAPATALPTVTDAVIIDGYTQPGSSVNTLGQGDNAVLLIELSGATLGSPNGQLFNGLNITGGSVVRGLVINRFSGTGLSLVSVNGANWINGNFIGTNPAGAARAANGDGISINANPVPPNSTSTLIGGTSPAERNVISGNSGFGVAVGPFPGGAMIEGNFIGTDAAGTAKLGNGSHGVEIRSTFNIVALNVISGNGQAGIFIQPDTQSAGNIIQSNFIGTDVTGDAALGNKFVGIWINFGSNNTIGGDGPGAPNSVAPNVISGNESSGILITGSLSRNNRINGNLIGTDGLRPLGNGKDGVEISEGAHDNFVEPAGPTPPPNTIAFNAGNGVTVLPPGTGNTIRRNNIFSNGGLGIDLNGDGVTPNDAGDADAFPLANNAQNFPIITSVGTGPSLGTTNIQGTLNSKPNTAYTLDFFTNAACDPSGNGEGARFFGGAGVNTDASGNATFSVTIGQPVPFNRVFTATASQSASPRDTSEFSPCFLIGSSTVGQVEFSSANYQFIEDIGDAVITVNRTGGSTGTLTVNYATTPGTATEGSDYTAASGTLTFADGETTKTFTVHVVNDGPVEPDETVGLVLFNTTEPEVVGTRGTSIMTIVDGTQLPGVGFGGSTPIPELLEGTSFGTYTVSLSAATGRTVSIKIQTSDGTATAGQDYQPVSQTLVFAPGEISKTVTVAVNGDTIDEPNETFFVSLSDPVNANAQPQSIEVTILNNDGPVLQFSAAAFSVGEGAHAFAVTVARSGDKSGTLTIDYATSDGTASERSDYTKALGTLRFAPGETSKTFDVLLTDDAFVEGSETVNLSLANPAGGAFFVGNTGAVLTITDNDSAPGPNPIDDPAFFVRQHYHDFLNREPDAAGLAFWTGQMANCGNPNLEVCRINVSAAFFKSIEFQETGYLVERTYKVAFGDATSPGVAGTVPVVRLNDFLFDTQQIGRGFIVGQGDWQAKLEANKVAYFLDFVGRTRFKSAFPPLMTPAEFVDALFQNAGVTPTAAERQAAIDEFGGAPIASDIPARARALRRVAENPTLNQREFNRAFVLMEYFGYLRRNPDDAPQPGLNYSGWRFWLDKLEEFNGNFVRAEMVKAFLASDEYRQRFAQ